MSAAKTRVLPGEPLRDIKSADIKLMRALLGVTQREFSAAYGISIESVRCWEQGRKPVKGPTRAFLSLLADRVFADLLSKEQKAKR